MGKIGFADWDSEETRSEKEIGRERPVEKIGFADWVSEKTECAKCKETRIYSCLCVVVVFLVAVAGWFNVWERVLGFVFD